MKKIVFLILSLFCAHTFFGQQDPQFSQNMFNKLANNPGFAGSREAISTAVLHRTQWIGFEDAPRTLNLSVDAPISILHGGVGLNIVQDNIAQHSNLGLQASYAYTSTLGNGQLGLGLSFGMYQSGIDGSKYNPAESADDAIPTASVTGSSVDLGAGIYYNRAPGT